jgi:hypothetical protein
MRTRFTLLFIALCAVSAWTQSQSLPQTPAPQARAACPDSKDLVNTDLFGAWVLELQGGTAPSVITRLAMVRNPEFAESLAGSFALGSTRHEVFGDIEDGALELEESTNGKDIIALWKGRVSGAEVGRFVRCRCLCTTQSPCVVFFPCLAGL